MVVVKYDNDGEATVIAMWVAGGCHEVITGDDSDDNEMKKMITKIEMMMMKMRANMIKMRMMTMVPRQLSLLCGGSPPRYFSVLRELGIE